MNSDLNWLKKSLPFLSYCCAFIMIFLNYFTSCSLGHVNWSVLYQSVPKKMMAGYNADLTFVSGNSSYVCWFTRGWCLCLLSVLHITSTSLNHHVAICLCGPLKTNPADNQCHVQINWLHFSMLSLYKQVKPFISLKKLLKFHKYVCSFWYSNLWICM